MIIRGPLSFVDAHTIRFLQAIAKCHGPLKVAPQQTLRTPLVALDDIRYMLGQLDCVLEVLDADKLPVDRAMLQFPGDSSNRLMIQTSRPAPLDEPVPEGYEMDRIDRSRSLVLLTGCFDLIHPGHIRMIEASCALDARPVVAILTSRGIAAQPKNKGDRPLYTMADRIFILKALRLSIQILLFEGPDSREIIEALSPDFWVKREGDFDRAIVQEEAALVERLGGKVIRVRDTLSTSSSAIAEAIRRRSVVDANNPRVPEVSQQVF